MKKTTVCSPDAEVANSSIVSRWSHCNTHMYCEQERSKEGQHVLPKSCHIWKLLASVWKSPHTRPCRSVGCTCRARQLERRTASHIFRSTTVCSTPRCHSRVFHPSRISEYLGWPDIDLCSSRQILTLDERFWVCRLSSVGAELTRGLRKHK